MAARSGHGKKGGCRSLPFFPSSSPSALRSQIGSRCILSRLAAITESQHERDKFRKNSKEKYGTYGISTQNKCREEVGGEAIIIRRAKPPDHSPTLFTHLFGFSGTFIAVTLGDNVHPK